MRGFLLAALITNAGGRTPAVARVDLIAGDVTGPVADRGADRNASTRVLRRFGPADWQRQGEVLTMTHRLTADRRLYLRVRGTAGQEAEPLADPRGENPWDDLWFYGNPIFVTPKDHR